MSAAGRLYSFAYKLLCGEHPHVRPWHFQWLPVKDLYRDLRELLPMFEGELLDVGCGNKPYAIWFTPGKVHAHVGIDVASAPKVDVVITPGVPWALDSGAFDGVLCTQVLEHAADLDHVIQEMVRVLKPGGLLLVTVPFIYNEHGAPDDYRRFSVHGARNLLEPQFEVQRVIREGAIGSTLGTLWLNWLNEALNAHKLLRLGRAPLLPAWIVFCGAVNLVCATVDRLDRTGAYYNNTLVLARKRGKEEDGHERSRE
ncbi:MAG: class I SAM-dependent methyltransferase [Armatimonadota bacterium]|nr:class I SAM-dependent methyltransferase [Armatimonadota bacterium]